MIYIRSNANSIDNNNKLFAIFENSQKELITPPTPRPPSGTQSVLVNRLNLEP